MHQREVEQRSHSRAETTRRQTREKVEAATPEAEAGRNNEVNSSLHNRAFVPITSKAFDIVALPASDDNKCMIGIVQGHEVQGANLQVIEVHESHGRQLHTVAATVLFGKVS
jgi:hypothetical protein